MYLLGFSTYVFNYLFTEIKQIKKAEKVTVP